MKRVEPVEATKCPLFTTLLIYIDLVVNNFSSKKKKKCAIIFVCGIIFANINLTIISNKVFIRGLMIQQIAVFTKCAYDGINSFTKRFLRIMK